MEETQTVLETTENVVLENTTEVSTKKSFDEILNDKEYQAEFDRRLGKALNTQKEKYESEKQTYLTNQAKLEDEIKSYQDKFNAESSKVGNLERENLIMKNGIIDADEIEFINFKIGKMEGEFKDNLEEYLKNKPKSKPITTGYEQKNIATSNPDKDYLDKKYGWYYKNK